MQLADLLILLWDLHQGAQGEGRQRILREHVDNFVKFDELKVVEGSHREIVVELSHHVPRTISDPDKDDAKWEVAVRITER